MSESRSFVRLFVGFILTATGVCTCPIELSPPTVVVKYGDPVSINCSTSDSRVDSMGWEAPQGGTGLKPVKHLTWSVENLQDWTISSFCFINIDTIAFQCQKMSEIVLYTFPDNISISSSSDSEGDVFLLRENEEHNFLCNVNHVAPVQNLSIQWYKDNTMIHEDTFNSTDRKPVNQPSFLKYRMTRQDNGATLRCEAHMDLRPKGPQLNVSSQEYEITVLFGPDIKCSDIKLLEGETLENKCSVEGNPTPSVKWLKDEEVTNLSFPLSRKDAGLYIIEAEGISYIRKTVQVLVLYKPELTCTGLHNTALEYVPHNITCTGIGYPEPNIIWYKDGEEVALPKKLTRSDAGQYVVIASNELSSVNVTLEITVTYPPSTIAELEDSEVEVGSDISLKCSSVANPRPKYFWNYYRIANVKEVSEDGVSRLVIHNATAYNMGSYTCNASNERGNVSKTVRLNVRGANRECPIEISPNRMVIQYQAKGQIAICKVKSTDIRNVKLFWEDKMGTKTYNESWLVDTNKDWDPRPFCTAKFVGIGKCQKPLDFSLYKTPDIVFISTNLSSMMNDREFQLHCDIINVAPAQSLAVRWYQGTELIEGSFEEFECSSGNNTNCNISVIKSPVNVSSTINISLNTTLRSVQFICVAELNLGPEGPQTPLIMVSSPLNITVYTKPSINTKKLPKTVPLFSGYPEVLVCEADGHPDPKMQWSYKSVNVSGNTFNVTEPGLYTCIASNTAGSSFHAVEVILKEDYLPLIAGFVAVTVVVISVIFLFIYSIYYKNTKMRRYSLKNPKLSNHNGNVAHNGWDMQFPMTRLS